MAKIAGLAILIPVVAVMIIAVALLYLYQGERISSQTINTQVQTALQSVIGDAYRVEIENTGLAFVSSSLLSLQGENVRIFENGQNALVATLNEVEVGLDPLSLFSESFRFSNLQVNGGSLDLSALKAESRGAPGLSENLSRIARQADQISNPFASGLIETIEVLGVTVSGIGLGRRKPDDPLRLSRLLIEGTPESGVTFTAATITSLSNPVISARWTPASAGGQGELTAGIGPVNALEFFSQADPIMALTEDKPDGIGIQTRFRADIRIPYAEDYEPVSPFMKLQADGGELRVGKNQTTPINHLVANLRADFGRDLIMLERGDVSLGPVTFFASGLLQLPDTATPDRSLPLNLSLVDFTSTDPLWQEQNPLESVVLDGAYTPGSRQLDVRSLRFSDTGGHLLEAAGAAAFPDGVSPSIRAQLRAGELPVAMLQNIWPFNLAPPVRRWIRNELSGGSFSNLRADFDIARGRLTEVDNGSGFAPQEFSLAADIDGVSVPTIGDLPPLQGLNGSLSINGSRLEVLGGEGVLQSKGGEAVDVIGIELVVEDMFTKPPKAELDASLSAPLAAIATLASAKPLEVPQLVGISPGSLSGAAEVALNVAFPLVETPDRGGVDWRATVQLEDASSDEPLFEQSIRNANVTIEARPTLLTAKGTAEISGFSATLDIAEPIGGGDTAKRSRTISTSLTSKQLAEQGIDLSPVVSGRLDVTIRTGANGLDRYEIDLTRADLSLPWVSWSKGAGIRSNASFILEQKGDTNTIRDFAISGPTYKAAGTLSFNKSGLIAANLKNVVLVKGDLFDVSVSRKAGRYIISTNGRAFDGRAIINKVIHGDGFGEDSAATDVSLTANFGRLTGFNGQVMENALVRYETDRGRLSLLQVRGAINGGLSTIDASAQGNRTTFVFDSRNAGGALALVDIYRKMEGGRLRSELVRTGDGPFRGQVELKKFTVIGEERLQSLVAAPPENNQLRRASGRLQELNVQRVRFDDMVADIEKDENLLVVRDGRIRNQQIGLTFDGTIFDPNDQMSVRGTFMPLFSVSRLIGGIPIIGDILSNGKNSGLIGITYRLKGPSGDPNILVNPVSIIAPGIFRQIFQFQE